MIEPESRIVFYGDSITDCGRDRAVSEPNEALGSGYANMAASQLNAQYPHWDLKFWNRGIGGNRVYDLEERLKKEVLALRPDIVSILIGINDTWRRYDSGTESPIPEFSASFKRMLKKLDESKVQVLLLEPFVLPVPDDRRAWREDLSPRIEAVRDLAREFELPLVPLDGLFAAASARRPSAFWAADGVHPTPAGHALLTRQWIEAALDD